ncbi:Adhesive plaque matrix protein 2 [Symbiodinium microadriaticum]|uniref:Adhesive plaque matrix protein 2 n=1 Tax=Symbiodinium microadriaticum TaxID=2951 RepID=A0A1Q9D054_SYMMI|nr:Adhesive plaque matrix protein 2 [Symbiodinium microadriaticum]
MRDPALLAWAFAVHAAAIQEHDAALDMGSHIHPEVQGGVMAASVFESLNGCELWSVLGVVVADLMLRRFYVRLMVEGSGMVQLCRQHLLLGLQVAASEEEPLAFPFHTKCSGARRLPALELGCPRFFLGGGNGMKIGLVVAFVQVMPTLIKDFFSDLNDLLRKLSLETGAQVSSTGCLMTLDLVWFLVAAMIALALACWQPAEIVGDTSEVGSDGVKWTPPPWYALTTIFASLSSHAAGILGFVGFQKIVVARIVSTSQPRANWSAPNFLLLTSIAISITAIFSSLVFMGVDYLRRLAIDSAWSRGYRLVVMRGRLERTGLGMALIMLTLVLIVLYMLVIYMETQNSKKQEDSSESAASTSRDMQIFLDKVQFHRIIAGAGEDLGEISIEDYFKKFCDGRDETWSSIRSGLAGVANRLAGEDLGLFVKMGTRRALFPNQRLAPLLNVGIVMLFGMLPGVFQFATEKLFVDPQILAVSIEICCETDPDNCAHYTLEHSLIEFDEKPAILEIPAASSTRCSLTARGLSKKSSTTLDLMVAVKSVKNVCDCGCADNVENSVGEGCKCKDGYVGDITTRVQVFGCVFWADHVDGRKAKGQMPDGFVGKIVWKDDVPHGSCRTASEDISHGTVHQLQARVSPCPAMFSTLTTHQEEALHVTRLVADLTDDSYNTCRAGQAMLVHGHTYGNLRLRWTFAEALPPAKCKVEWPDSHIEVNNPDPEHFSLTSWCSAMPGQPFCWSPIVYTVTTRNTSQFACDSCKTSEHALTEFRGSRCGYDLIKWESLTINPGSPNACECNLSLSCSELPSEELPRACIHFAEPAILSKDDGDYLVFYETGEVSQAITSTELSFGAASCADDVDQADELGAVSANWRWLCDGENLFVVKAGDIDIWSGDAGSFYSKDYSATLQPRAVLPAWWEVKFQHLALPGSFNTDTLLGCELSFQSGTMCYHTLFGSSVRVAPAQGDCAFQNFTAADSHVLYEYKSSAFGVQTYRSSKTCYPKAAFEEIRVQMEDVVLPADRFETEVGSDAAGRNPEGRTSIDTMCKMSLPSFATPRSGMVQLCRQHLLLGLHVVLGVCLHLSLAARASSWEATTLYLGILWLDWMSIRFGEDFFSDLNDLLRKLSLETGAQVSSTGCLMTLDLVWFLVAAMIALALEPWHAGNLRRLLVTPRRLAAGAREGTPEGSDGVKWAPPPWYALTTIFASLSSHAAGILGFVGFQKIVVARIVSTSQPRANWSAPNFLLLTSIAISITAIFSSLVFMGVDYLRRLAIDSAWSRGYRLVVMRGRLERTGLGMALIMLTLVLIVLYMLVIYMETQNSKKQEDSSESAASTSRDMQIFLDKVQFHRIIAGAGEDLGEISIEDYFKKFCDGRDERSSIRSGLAGVANRLAGEDLGLFVKMGTRRALFPNQRLAPLLNVGIVMLFGMLPGVFQFATEKLFVDPQILAVSIEICCETDPGNCTRYALEHSLIQFDEKPAILEIPAESSTRCSLTARGLSKKSSTTLDLMVAVKAIKNVCDCHKNICSCCNGYQGELDADGEEVQKLLATDFCTPVPCGIDNSNRKPGPECNCSNGYVGDIVWEGTNVSGNCTPAPCYVEDSNRKPGLECQCRDGFGGEVRWEGSEASGKCLPATCNILYSTGTGKGCRCQDGYQGDIKWNGDRVTGHCTPAACDIENSTKEPGLQCQCRDGFAGKVHWKGSEAFGECLPADCSIPYSTGMGADCRCMDGYAGSINWNHRSQPQGKCVPAVGCADNVENSVGEGPQCKCKDGFTGKVLWQGAVPHGSCKAAECHIKNANQQPGPGCKCKDGYVGDISWHGDRPSGTCTPAPCPIKNSNREPGPQCACLDGFAGEIAWKGQVPSGYCSAAPCVSIEHSNGKPGLECKCKDGFTGSIRWHASVPQGSCQAAECYIANANQQPGPGCECKDGYVGEITWHGDRPSGTCTPAPCMIENSNARTAFLELLRGEVMSPMDDAGKDVVGLYIFYETGDLLLTPSAELSRADDSEEADRLGAESADHTWLSDGENVLSIGPHNTEIWLGSTAGSHFVYNGSVLWARTALPEWWKVKFKQEAALPGSFNTDKLAGCEFAFKSGNLCYSARLGQSVWVAPAHGDCRFQDITNADKSIAHKYRSSAFGIQTYRSNVTCYPTAAFEEILVQVVDVGMPAEDFNYTVASSPCRTTIRYMTDARSKLSECSFFR